MKQRSADGKRATAISIDHCLIEFDGLEVCVYRSTIGKNKGMLTVSIGSHNMGEDGPDVHSASGVPRLRVIVNDGDADVLSVAGDWETES